MQLNSRLYIRIYKIEINRDREREGETDFRSLTREWEKEGVSCVYT